MTVNSAVILMCQSCNDGAYLLYYQYFITFFTLILDL